LKKGIKAKLPETNIKEACIADRSMIFLVYMELKGNLIRKKGQASRKQNGLPDLFLKTLASDLLMVMVFGLRHGQGSWCATFLPEMQAK
jgi:hypothetical protein